VAIEMIMDPPQVLYLLRAETMTLDAEVTVVGAGRLILLAADLRVLGSSIDLSGGAGALLPEDCEDAVVNATAGAPGGSFAASGGRGGDGGGGAGSPSGAVVNPPSRLRGGCPGLPAETEPPSVGANAGGGLQLVGLERLEISADSRLRANGAGGAGGAGSQSGGGGGGSGGMIVLDSPQILVAGGIEANGGGGGGGDDGNGPAQSGDGGRSGPCGSGGDGPVRGGDGGCGMTTALNGGNGLVVSQGGGGGGGSVGYIFVTSTPVTNLADISPQPQMP
jgi:hypothetical protein